MENKEIVEEKEEVVEKKKSNTIINILIFLVILVVSVIMYGKYLAPKFLSVKEYRINNKNIPNNFSGMKIVYFSDILYGSTYYKDELNKLKEKINELKPDILIFGGDLISKGYKVNDNDKKTIETFFKGLNSKIAKYATLGSNDAYYSKEVLTNNEFILLENSSDFIYNEELTPICIFGLSSYNKGEYNIEETFKDKSDCAYKILVSHEGDIIDKVLKSKEKVDLMLSGNTVGGIINIPFYGGIYKFAGSKKYYKESYNIDNTLLYISNGLGSKEYNFRLFNTPSITLIRLKSVN